MSETEKMDNLIIAMQKMHRWRMAFFGLVILLAGIVIGISIMLIVNPSKFKAPLPPPEIASERMIRDLRHHLHLSPEQADIIMPILKEHLERMHEIRMGVRPQIVEQIRAMDEQISPLLNDQQRQIWRQHFQRMQKDLEQGPRLKRFGQPLPPQNQNRRRPGKPMPPPDGTP